MSACYNFSRDKTKVKVIFTFYTKLLTGKRKDFALPEFAQTPRTVSVRTYQTDSRVQ